MNLEIAECCTVWNMDEKFAGADKVVPMKGEEESRLEVFLILGEKNNIIILENC